MEPELKNLTKQRATAFSKPVGEQQQKNYFGPSREPGEKQEDLFLAPIMNINVTLHKVARSIPN